MIAVVRTHGLAALALCLAVGCADRPGPGLTYTNYERIKEDGTMTEEEVNQLLGSRGTEVRDFGKEFEKLSKRLGKVLGKAHEGDAAAPVARKTVRWGTENRYVICTFVNGKVETKDQRGL